VSAADERAVVSDDVVTVVPAGKLVFGIQLPTVALSTMVAAPWEREDGAGVPELVRAAQAADRAGFFYVAVCDHVAIPRQLAPAMSTTWYEPISTLGFLAGQTTRTRLMTNVFVGPYRHPLQTAKAFATLDTLSGGRVILGMGAGHVEKEFDALGLPFAERGRLLASPLPHARLLRSSMSAETWDEPRCQDHSSERNQVTACGIAWTQLLTWSKCDSERSVTSAPPLRSRSTDTSAHLHTGPPRRPGSGK